MIGKHDRRVTFIQPVISTGTSNEDKITAWEEIDSNPTVWARKIEEGGSTAVNADRVTHSRATTWVIRHREDLNVRMRLVWDTQMYEIINIAEADEGRRRYLNVLTSLLDNQYFT